MIAGTGLILIVGDDRDAVEPMASYLETHDYIVLKAYGAREGLALARLERPDLVILDGRGAAETALILEAIRGQAELRSVPVVLIEVEPLTPGLHPQSEENGALNHLFVAANQLELSRLLDLIRRGLQAHQAASAR